jgi:hypothetical protein
VSSDAMVLVEASARGEGFGPTTGSVDLGGGKGQESIGSAVRLTAHNRVRTLSRSKALKSQALACRRRLHATFRGPSAPKRAHVLIPRRRLKPLARSRFHFGGAATGTMLHPRSGSHGQTARRRTESAGKPGHSPTGAKAELELARAKLESAETAGEHVASRGVAAG